MNRLANCTALVIGSATGIGREVCRLFALEGAAVGVADFGHTDERTSLVTELRQPGRDAFDLEVDVRDEEQVRAAIEAAIARFGKLDILVNNAGIGGNRVPLHEESAELFERVMDVNLRGVFFGMKHALPHMLERGSGRIINTASQLAHKPAPLNASYSASKAGVVALTVAAAQEVGRAGVTVNAVCPGPTDTPLWNRPGNEESARWKQQKLESLPLGRIGQPVEIAWAYVYLASDEAAYVTGQSISPNGGDVMW